MLPPITERAVRVAACFSMLLCCSCQPAAERPRASLSSSSTQAAQLPSLRSYEAVLRSSYSPTEQPAWIDASGADPYRLAPLSMTSGARPDGYVGILRGSKAVVRLDSDLTESARIPLDESPTALCVAPDHASAYVASRFSPIVQRIELGPGAATKIASSWRIPAVGVTDLACGSGGLVYVLSADPPQVATFDGGRLVAEIPALRGDLRLIRRGQYLLEISLFERTLRVLELDGRGIPGREMGRIRHDGPIWAADLAERDGTLVVAIAGVEDKPLVRVHGEFENIDSFVWLYRYRGGLERLAELNVGERGLVVPKSIALRAEGDGFTVATLAAGSGYALTAHFTPSGALRSARAEPAPPGVSDAVFEEGRVLYASPLLDAWVSFDEHRRRVEVVDATRRPEPDVRLGEALFFTDLMAPNNSSTGTHSRFSCETCHFEGSVDGRTHYTGRGDVSVVTKPLFGLANNRPHFSRALDPDLSAVSHHEFRVAGAGSGTDPWFSLETARFTWLSELGLSSGRITALDLRRALMRFLYEFSHEPNARALSRSSFTPLEERGARAFLAHCERCHSARLFSDGAETRVPLSDWAHLILRRNAPLVWARGEYEQTGVLPYVHERGTRITSLRRLALKPRFFTNGSAASLDEVLRLFRDQAGNQHHGADGQAAGLDADTRKALLAFLELL